MRAAFPMGALSNRLEITVAFRMGICSNLNGMPCDEPVLARKSPGSPESAAPEHQWASSSGRFILELGCWIVALR